MSSYLKDECALRNRCVVLSRRELVLREDEYALLDGYAVLRKDEYGLSNHDVVRFDGDVVPPKHDIGLGYRDNVGMECEGGLVYCGFGLREDEGGMWEGDRVIGRGG